MALDAAAKALPLAPAIGRCASTPLNSWPPDAPSRPIAPASALRTATSSAAALPGLLARIRMRHAWMIRRTIAIRNLEMRIARVFALLSQSKGYGGGEKLGRAAVEEDGFGSEG